jgi:hypothetical protein
LSLATLNAQTSYAFKEVIDSPEHPQCVYPQYQTLLKEFAKNKVNRHSQLLNSRSNNGRFELRIYVDTSYERRRTGAYNRNDSVTSYLNKLVDSIEWMFNVAAPYWDVDMETDVIFFDSITPFSYGMNTSETLINFYNWIDSLGYPGNDDNYVFYTGKYSNQGVSFVGELCSPGGSVMGFVNSFNQNVDLSSHEWVGHSANSLHYNSEVNIMNSIANRPWNSASLQVIQNYLDNQTCVVNVQSPLAFKFTSFSAHLKNNIVRLDWDINQSEVEYFLVERKDQLNDWKEIGTIPQNMFYLDQLHGSGLYYYRVKAHLINQDEVLSESKVLVYNSQEPISIIDNEIRNPDHKRISIYDILGRRILQSNESEIKLKECLNSQILFIECENNMIKLFLPN